MKPVNFFIILFGLLTAGCSLVPMQKAGSEALAEAICVYDKKIDKASAKFTECLAEQTH